MISVNLQEIAKVEINHHHRANGIDHFSVAVLKDASGSEVKLFVTAEQANAIAAAFAPKFNAAGIPIYEGRAA